MRHQWAPNDRGLHQSKSVPTGLLQQNHQYYGILCVKIHNIDSFFLKKKKRDKNPNDYVMYSKPVTLKQFKNVVVTFSLRWRLERNQATRCSSQRCPTYTGSRKITEQARSIQRGIILLRGSWPHQCHLKVYITLPHHQYYFFKFMHVNIRV